jgi:predicted outer membrane repeat protein
MNIKHYLLTLIFVTTSALSSGDIFFVTDNGSGDCSQANPCSLVTALSSADNYDNIYFAGGMYIGSGDEVISVTKHLSFYGGWDGELSGPIVRDPQSHPSYIDGGDKRRAFKIEENLRVLIRDLYISGCKTDENGSGIYAINPIFLTLADVTMDSNVASNETDSTNRTYTHGGAIFVKGGKLTIERGTFSRNTSRDDGGAIYTVDTNVSIKNSNFIHNTAWSSSALYAASSNKGTLILEDNNFTKNQNGETKRGNSMMMILNFDANISRNIISKNIGYQQSAIRIFYTNLIFTQNLIFENSFGQASALEINYPLQSNYISNNVFVNNISNNQYGTATVIFNNFTNNHSYDDMVFLHNTLANNTNDDGQKCNYGVLLKNTGEIKMSNNIIVGNKVGINVDDTSSLKIDTTLWGEINANDINLNGTGTINDTHNLIGDPKFVNPADNNFHIRANSAARDAGIVTAETIDIDSETRPEGDSYDIGADEFVNTFTSPALIMYLLN